MAKAKISGLLLEGPQTTNNTQVNIASDIDAARRIGYIMARGLQLLQMKQIESKVEEEGKIDEVTKARLAIGLPNNRFYDAGDNVKCPLSGVKQT